MPKWRIEVIAPEPPWGVPPGVASLPTELPTALSDLGHQVRVLFPEGAESPPTGPRSVTAVPIRIDRTRRSAPRTSAFGRRLAGEIDRKADLWLALDPSAGALPVTQGPGPLYAYLAESAAVDDPRRAPSDGVKSGLRGRAETWWDRRVLRRLEEAALWRARLVFATSPTTAERLGALFQVPADRIRTILRPSPTRNRAERRKRPGWRCTSPPMFR